MTIKTLLAGADLLAVARLSPEHQAVVGKGEIEVAVEGRQMRTPMPLYLIGTREFQGGAACVRSRAARSYRLDEAMEETRIYSRARHVEESWLREYWSTDTDHSPVFARFRKGRRLS